MTLFELTSIVLDKLYQQGMDKYGSAEVDGQVRKSLCTLSTSFGDLDNPQRQSSHLQNSNSTSRAKLMAFDSWQFLALIRRWAAGGASPR